VSALVVALALQPVVVASQTAPVVEQRPSSSRKGKHVARALVPQNSGSTILERYNLAPYQVYSPKTGTWTTSQNWTLSGRSGIGYAPQRNAASTSSSSVSAAPSLTTYVPPNWSRRPRSIYYAVPIIVVCSVVLSVAIVLVILMSVAVRQKKAKRAKQARLEDIEGRTARPDAAEPIIKGRGKLRSKIRRRFRRRRRKIILNSIPAETDTVQSAADDSYSAENSIISLTRTERYSTRLHSSFEHLIPPHLSTDSSPAQSTLSRRPSASSSAFVASLPQEHGSLGSGNISHHTSRQSMRSMSSEIAGELESSPTSESHGVPLGPRSSTDSHLHASPPAYRPNSISQRLTGAASGNLYSSSTSHHERRPSYATAVAGTFNTQAVRARTEEKRRAIDPLGAVDPTELEEAGEESPRPTEFTAHVSTDDKATLGRLEGLASLPPPRLEESSFGPSAPLFNGDVASHSIWEDVSEEVMKTPPTEPADISLDMSGSSSLPAPPTPFESAFSSYSTVATPYPPPLPPSPPAEMAEPSAPPLSIFADPDSTPTAPVLPLYEPRSQSPSP
jgi:hypothetical protein